jgi:general L-amino acid transport system permease protein
MKLLKNRKFRNFALQAGYVGALLALLIAAILIGKHNLEQQGITSGFAFLDRATGFDVGFSLIDFEPSDTFGKMLLVGLLNTIFLGIIGIILANLIGLLIAVCRISPNATLNALGTLYVETFRNIPMILQAFFFYAVMTNLPRPKEAFSIFDFAFLSSRGIYVPGLNVSGGAAALALATIALGLVGVVWFSASRRFSRIPQSRRRTIFWFVLGVSAIIAGMLLWAGRLTETPLVSIPTLQGLNIRDGIRIPPELSALAISMGIYGGAYMAEIIRAGFLSVGKGQVEAAKSLGLRPWYVFSRVRMPLAIRAVLPTLINQYVWLFKATTLGIAIGFTDFFMVVSVSINQAGQTLELIGLLMLGFLIMNNTIAFVLNRVNKAIALKGSQLRT